VRLTALERSEFNGQRPTSPTSNPYSPIFIGLHAEAPSRPHPRRASGHGGAPDGERKTITVLFADLAGFTALTRDLDPEEARTLIDPALQLMMDVGHR
jgi:class 3 adenylate cyclase